MARRNVSQQLSADDDISRLAALSGERIAELEAELRRQKAANDEAEANLVLSDVIQGNKDVGDVPPELLADLKKVVEKRIQKIAAAIHLRSQ